MLKDLSIEWDSHILLYIVFNIILKIFLWGAICHEQGNLPCKNGFHICIVAVILSLCSAVLFYLLDC